jgi:hypothetical protein
MQELREGFKQTKNLIGIFQLGWRLGPQQGGILFWLRGNLRDRPGILPEITFTENKIDDRKCLKRLYFLKCTVNYPFKQEFILIDSKTR